MRHLLPSLLTLLTLGLLAGLWLQLPGANGPPEWRWEYRSAGLAAAGVPILLLGLLLIAAALARGGRFAGSRPGLALLVLLGLGLTLAVVQAQPGGFGRVLQSLVSRHSFSYVFDAGVAPPTRELLADYPAASALLDLHSRTHPPGPLLLVRGLDALTRRLPLPEPGEGGIAAAARDAMAHEVSRARDRGRPAPAVPPGPWSLVVLGLLLPALSALTAWPLHRLARSWGLPPAAAALAVLLWLLTPARSLFTPSLDQALPLLLVGAAALAAAGGRATAVKAVAAGLLAAAACFLSYGCLATLPWLALVALGAGREESREEAPLWRPASLRRPALLGVGFLLPWLVLALATGYAPWRDFRIAITAHRAMAVVTRSYATWVGWNLYDFVLLAGPAMVALALAALWPEPVDPPRPARAFRLGLWGFWGLLLLLDLSGSVRGEVGRIWLFFMPFAALFASGERRSGPAPALLLALLQLALLYSLAANLVFVS